MWIYPHVLCCTFILTCVSFPFLSFPFLSFPFLSFPPPAHPDVRGVSLPSYPRDDDDRFRGWYDPQISNPSPLLSPTVFYYFARPRNPPARTRPSDPLLHTRDALVDDPPSPPPSPSSSPRFAAPHLNASILHPLSSERTRASVSWPTAALDAPLYTRGDISHAQIYAHAHARCHPRSAHVRVLVIDAVIVDVDVIVLFPAAFPVVV